MAAHRTLVGTAAARPRLVLALAAHWRAERLAALRYSLERRAGRSSACAAPAGQHDRCAADSAPAPGGLPPPRRGALTRAVGTCRRALRAVAHRRTVSISPAARRSAAQSGPACCRMQAKSSCVHVEGHLGAVADTAVGGGVSDVNPHVSFTVPQGQRCRQGQQLHPHRLRQNGGPRCGSDSGRARSSCRASALRPRQAEAGQPGGGGVLAHPDTQLIECQGGSKGL